LWRRVTPVRRCRIRLWGIDYEGDGLHGVTSCVSFINTADMSEIYCYDLDGRYLGDAYPVQALHPLAKMFGDEVSIDQVKRAIERQRQDEKMVKNRLLRMNVGAELIEALPYAPKMAAVIQGGAAEQPQLPAPAAETISDDERRRLELVYEREATAPEAPAIERPAYWTSELERYEWCFRASVQHGMDIGNEDRAFMAYYEQTREYRESFADRFDQLRQLYM
jgi:putative transposase